MERSHCWCLRARLFRTDNSKQQPAGAPPSSPLPNYCALCLIIKAKLEYVESGHAIFEREFMANIVDPVTGKTMGEVVQPLIENRYQGIENKPALFLPGPTK